MPPARSGCGPRTRGRARTHRPAPRTAPRQPAGSWPPTVASAVAGAAFGGAGGGSGSRRLVKHCPHHSASPLTSAPQFGQRRSALTPGGYPRFPPPGTKLRRSRPPRSARPRAGSRSAATCGHAAPARGRPRPSPRPARGLRAGWRRRRRPLARAATVHQDAGLAVDQRLARATRVADHHGPPAGRGLDEHVAPPFDLEPPQARAARHREHVTERVVPRQVVLRDLPGEDHRVAEAPRRATGAGPRRARRRRSRGSPRATRSRIAGSASINVSCPLRFTSRLTHTTTGRSSEPVRGAEVLGHEVGMEPLDVRARVQHRHRHLRGHRGADGARDEGRTEHRDARRRAGGASHQRVRSRARARASTRSRAPRSDRAGRAPQGAVRAARAGRWRRTAPPRRRASAPRPPPGRRTPRVGHRNRSGCRNTRKGTAAS